MESNISIQIDPGSISDEDLLEAFKIRGDHVAFETLVKRYQHEIYNFLRRYLGDEALAEDAFQTTFLRVYQKADQFDATRRFRPWLYGIATHQAIDWKRSAKRREYKSLDCKVCINGSCESSHAASVVDYRTPSADVLLADELTERVRSALDELGEPGRSAVELVHLQGLAYRDAADVLDVPVGTVKSRVHTALRKLAEIWKRMNY